MIKDLINSYLNAVIIIIETELPYSFNRCQPYIEALNAKCEMNEKNYWLLGD